MAAKHDLRRSSWQLTTLILGLVASLDAAAAEQTQASRGIVACDHKALLQAEEHRTQNNGDLLSETRYVAGDGELRGSESLHMIGAPQRLANYQFQDLGSGELTVVDVVGDKAQVQYRASKDDEVKKATLDWGPQTITGAAMPVLIAQHWADLRAGKSVDFDLLVPFRLETVGFRLSIPDAASRTHGSPLSVIAEARNWLIRQLAPKVAFAYADDKVPRLLRYDGPAPVMIGEDKGKTVQIEFSPVAPAS